MRDLAQVPSRFDEELSPPSLCILLQWFVSVIFILPHGFKLSVGIVELSNAVLLPVGRKRNLPAELSRFVILPFNTVGWSYLYDNCLHFAARVVLSTQNIGLLCQDRAREAEEHC